MAGIYDNGERVAGATLHREEQWFIRLRSASELSLASTSSSFNFDPESSSFDSFDFSSLLLDGNPFTYHQILQATDSLSDSNLIKKGRSGDLYYGVLESGTQVVIKKIDLSLWTSSEIQFLHQFSSHSRLVPLLGHCLEYMDEKFLVYKFMPNKDLSRYLYRSPDDRLQFSSLDWPTRLRIAIGAAEGLCFLHHECIPPFVHRGFEASSILLDENFQVRLGSLSEIYTAAEKVAQENRIMKLLRLSSGAGRRIEGKANEATCADDVYCFGKVLLQLVTGRLRPDTAGDSADPFSPSPLANNWKDLIVQIYDRELVRTVLDPSSRMEKERFFQVWAAAVVAVACLDPKPSRRPQMTEVLKALRSGKVSESCYSEMAKTIESFRTFLGPISPKFFR